MLSGCPEPTSRPPLVCEQGFEPEVVAGGFLWRLPLLKPILLGTGHGEALSSSRDLLCHQQPANPAVPQGPSAGRKGEEGLVLFCFGFCLKL